MSGERGSGPAVTVWLVALVVVGTAPMVVTASATAGAASNTGYVRGTVTDASGTPIEGATVELVDSNGNVAASLSTDGTGDFGPVEVAADSYQVEVRKSGYESFSTAITLDSGETEAVPAILESNTGYVKGGVTDAAGNPVEGATVELVDGNGDVAASRSTDESGDFGPVGVAADSYQVEVRKSGFTPFTTSITLDSGETEAVPAILESNTGYVKGGITDAAGDPVEGVTVELVDSSGTVAASLSTDGTGDFGPVEVAADSYQVGVRKSGYGSFSTAISLEPDETEDVPVVLESNTGYLKGTVRDVDGDPVSGATVALRNRSGDVVATRSTNDVGYFGPTEVVADSYQVEVRKSGYEPTSKAVTLDVDETRRVSVGLAARTGHVEGTVDDDAGDPVEGATVELVDGNGSVTAALSTDGTGEFGPVEVAADSYRIDVRKSGYEPASKDRTVDAGETESVTFVLRSDTVDVEGTVTDGDGSPVAGADVRIEDGDGDVVASTTADDDGGYSLVVPTGNYTVVATTADGETERAARIAEDDTEADVDLAVDATATSRPSTETASPTRSATPTTGTPAATADAEPPADGTTTQAATPGGQTTSGTGPGFGPLALLSAAAALLLAMRGNLPGRRD